MRTLICGSLAFDSIMVFQDHFKHHILPDKVHTLNVSFLVPTLRREFGGCAGNVAYNLQLLGDEGYPLGTVGDDFGPYAEWLDRQGVNQADVLGLGVAQRTFRPLPLGNLRLQLLVGLAERGAGLLHLLLQAVLTTVMKQ